MQVLAALRSSTSELTLYFVHCLVFSTIGPLLFGFHLAELNAPQDVITCKRRSINSSDSAGLPQCIPMTPLQFGLVQSIFTLGGLCGALTVGPLSARHGRLILMRINTFFCSIGPIAEALSPNVGVMALGRFTSGLGAGAALVIVPMYISEISPPAQRGLFGAFTQIMTNFGIFLAQLLGLFLSHDSMWRVILAVGGAIGVFQLAGLMFAIDSPRWQAEQAGNFKEAERDLARIRGENADISQEIATWDVRGSVGTDEIGEQQTLLSPNGAAADINDDLHADPRKPDERHSLSFFQVIVHPLYYRAIIAVIGVMIAQQFTGINSIVMYGVSLLADLLAANSALLNVFVSLLNVVITTACAPLSDILGRKTCLLMSIGAMGSAAVLLGIGIRAHVAVLSAIAVLLFVAGFGLGLGPIPFILSSELVGPEAVGATQSWALAANWIATFVVAQFFPIVNESLGKGMVYFLFAALAVIFGLFVGTLVPETKGKKSVEEVWGRDREGVAIVGRQGHQD